MDEPANRGVEISILGAPSSRDDYPEELDYLPSPKTRKAQEAWFATLDFSSSEESGVDPPTTPTSPVQIGPTEDLVVDVSSFENERQWPEVSEKEHVQSSRQESGDKPSPPAALPTPEQISPTAYAIEVAGFETERQLSELSEKEHVPSSQESGDEPEHWPYDEKVKTTKDAAEVANFQPEPQATESNVVLARWNAFSDCLKRPLLKLLVFIAKKSAMHPLVTILLTIGVSFALIATGLATNFNTETEGYQLWTPKGDVTNNDAWVESGASGFPGQELSVDIILHRKTGGNVVDLEGASRLFDISDILLNTEGYSDVCPFGEGNKDSDCTLSSATAFWKGHNRTLFQEQVTTDEGVALAMSDLQFANGQPVIRNAIFGFPDPECSPSVNTSVSTELVCAEGADNTILSSAEAYLVRMLMPLNENYRLSYEKLVLDSLVTLEETWEQNEGNDWGIAFIAERSMDDEISRGIVKDLPLILIAFTIMAVFCAITLFRCDPVQNHCMLGLGAISTIVLSLMSGYGLLFIIGVPFTSITQLFPYVMVGIGLDDTFILTGSFYRKDPSLDAIVRIEQTMEEVGISIFVTTLTTVTAFALGSIASIPAIKWFSYYAAPTVLIDFFYQISFFLALVIYDDRRIKANRYDIACCIKSRKDRGSAAEEGTAYSRSVSKMVNSYAELLLKPLTKVLVLVGFALLLAAGSLAASQQKQEFDYKDLTPADSYVRDFADALNTYSLDEGRGLYITGIYFRGVDESLPETREAMKTYVNELVDMPYISKPPKSFWVTDFETFLDFSGDLLLNATFEQQLNQFLGNEALAQLHGDNIVLDQNGSIAASRTFVVFDTINLDVDIPRQVHALQEQRDITARQPLNQGKDEPALFLQGPFMAIWVVFSVIVEEVMLTVVAGLVSIFVISLIFLPSPLAALLVTAVVTMIYVDLMGVLYWAGIYINPVTSIGLCMSIGLVVDYNLHIVMTYFEIREASDRNDRVKQTLNTMGRSITLGAFSTFLGVVPLAFVTTLSFSTFFYTFLGIVTLGAGHGLIFTPVVLSLIGPRVHDSTAKMTVYTSGSHTTQSTNEPSESTTTEEEVSQKEEVSHRTRYLTTASRFAFD